MDSLCSIIYYVTIQVTFKEEGDYTHSCYHIFAIEQFYHPFEKVDYYRPYQSFIGLMTLAEYFKKQGYGDHYEGCLTRCALWTFFDDLKLLMNAAKKNKNGFAHLKTVLAFALTQEYLFLRLFSLTARQILYMDFLFAIKCMHLTRMIAYSISQLF